MHKRIEDQPRSVREAFGKLTIEGLKPLLALVTSDVPKRKPEMVASLAGFMSRPEEVRSLYERLEPLAQKAVDEAAHDPHGRLHADRFVAKYGRLPDFYAPSPDGERRFYAYDRHTRPTPLALFFSRQEHLPADLQQLLLAFAPRPAAFALPAVPEVPATEELTWKTWEGRRYVEESEDVPLRVRGTTREALYDLRAVLRLVEAGRVRVSDKKRQPTAQSEEAIAQVLQGGDFYQAEDQDESQYDPAHDLAIKTFAWPMLLQAAGLAQKVGDNLELTPAGRKALSQPPHEVLRAVWKKWRNSKLLDEFSRVESIKGQGKAALSALDARRKAVLDALSHCPVSLWFKVDDFFRFLRATDRDFVLAHQVHELYIAEHYYGNLGYEGKHLWEMLQGRYILALLFEYLATPGLIDVAYLPPQGVRHDYQDRWGADDLSCLSRYDGLRYVRITPLGAWCLGLAEHYEPPALPRDEILRVLPNLEVVATRPPPPASAALVLNRFAEQQSEAVWRLTADRILPVLEKGGSLNELTEFLAAHSATPLPANVQIFLDDLRRRADRLRDLGLARLVECADPELAGMLAVDPQLRDRCHRAGERGLVFRTEDEDAVRRVLRRLGFILPPPQLPPHK